VKKSSEKTLVLLPSVMSIILFQDQFLLTKLVLSALATVSACVGIFSEFSVQVSVTNGKEIIASTS